LINLKAIVDFIKDKYKSRVFGEYDEDYIIDQVHILNEDTEIFQNGLYLTAKANLELLYGKKNILLVVNKVNESIDVLQVETESSIEKVHSGICKFIFTEYKLYAKKFNIYNSLYTFNDMNKTLNIAESYLENPIFILDTSYRIINRSNVANFIKEDILNYKDEYYLVTDIVNTMKKDRCIDNIYSFNKSFFHYSDKSLIFSGIRINNVTAAYICVVQKQRQFVEEDLEITNALAQVLSIQIERDNLFVSSSGLEEEYYLMDLLTNRIDNVIHIKERLENIEFKVRKSIQLIAIPFSQTYQEYRHSFGLKQLINIAKNILNNCIFTFYEEKIIFMVSTEEKDILAKNNKAKFIEFLKLNNLKAGVSLRFENILDTKEFYNQAIHALEFSERLKSQGYIFHFEDYLEYYIFHLCENIDNDVHRVDINTLIHPYIKELEDIDKENNGELLKTLVAYLECNRNANDTAKKLNIHCSTFFYRFHKIEDMLNISLNDGDILFKLELSSKILKYKGSF